ncbi:Universal stress protein family protein [Ralstonia sp. 25mfcol4.1]|uniref:universal stress protein n=1 Tax=Ralstonia sp. 25mfcol4.1 TaxID=1761899 RepID=UPI000401CD11|nr:universal stress protein [Ralstonia sp. 25mfcol4.1]SDP72229.1 Universal stress protein family protein [Ralstonia sp. 25mfcol4.1]
MDFATILVHLDGTRHLHQRVHLSTQLALANGARLIGLFATARPDPNDIRGLIDGDRYLASFNTWHDQACRAARTAFEGATSGVGITTEWRESESGSQSAVLVASRLADLIVLGQTDPTDRMASGDHQAVDEIILRCGRPVLVVPHTGSFPTIGQRVVVAWNGRGEAARAIRDALPILARATSVEIVQCVAPDRWEDPWCSPGQYAVAWLHDHGIHATLSESMLDNDAEAGELLLSRLADSDADLLVMGAYGHARMREVVLGGATRTLLRTMTTPVLLSH